MKKGEKFGSLNMLGNIKAFPNPVCNTFNIQISENQTSNYQVNIVNLAGHSVFGKTYSDPSISINTEGFTNGIYLLSIKTDDGKVLKSKLLKN